jgi:hypothetical protein
MVHLGHEHSDCGLLSVEAPLLLGEILQSVIDKEPFKFLFLPPLCAHLSLYIVEFLVVKHLELFS